MSAPVNQGYRPIKSIHKYRQQALSGLPEWQAGAMNTKTLSHHGFCFPSKFSAKPSRQATGYVVTDLSKQIQQQVWLNHPLIQSLHR